LNKRNDHRIIVIYSCKKLESKHNENYFTYLRKPIPCSIQKLILITKRRKKIKEEISLHEGEQCGRRF